MRSFDEYKQILELWERGINKKAIARETGIPHPTVRDCINRYGSVAEIDHLLENQPHRILVKTLRGEAAGDHTAIFSNYAYLFGLYLGDGSIVKLPRTYWLRITLDAKYPNIIDACSRAQSALLPDNRVGIQEFYYQGRLSYVNVGISHTEMPLFFPQYGEGAKHKRSIHLEAWQQRIVDTYPLEFFRGLYHSDGSRFSNVVNGKDYPRYQFTNYSDDMRAIFCSTCDRLDLHWTVKRLHKARPTDIYISRRKEVEFLDREIGPKT